MQFMIIERFHPGKQKILYERFAEKGRMMPGGLEYVNSWINEDVTVCYQVMEAPSETLLKQWIANWEDVADFEIVKVISSTEAREKVMDKGRDINK